MDFTVQSSCTCAVIPSHLQQGSITVKKQSWGFLKLLFSEDLNKMKVSAAPALPGCEVYAVAKASLN